MLNISILFPVETVEHFYQVVRYVERNPLPAHAVQRAKDWRWSSLWRRMEGKGRDRSWLSDWPLGRVRNWRALVNEPQTEWS